MKKEIKIAVAVVLSIWFFVMGFELGIYKGVEVDKLEVTVTDEEVNDRIAEMAKQYNMEVDAVKNAMHIVAAIKDDENNDMYRPKNGDVVKELIHILDTSKSLIGYQSSMVPRTRNASVFASIINIVNSIGTFDKLENSNIANDKLVKAFEGGKYYFIPQE